jgi:hypothetical protein
VATAQALEHLHFEALKRLSDTEMVRRLPCLDHVEQFCDVWASFRAKERLEHMHGDL